MSECNFPLFLSVGFFQLLTATPLQSSSLMEKPFSHQLNRPPKLAPALRWTRLWNLPSSADNYSLALTLATVFT